MLNKPKHSLFRNGRYAIEGLIEIAKNEASFKWQIALFVIGSVIAWSMPLSFGYSAILFISLFIPLIAEIINSAIERVVDMVTSEFHPLAKSAKDAGAAVVFLSLVVLALIWGSVLFLGLRIEG